MFYTINIDNYVIHKRLQAVIALPAYVVGNWGFYLLFDPKLQLWKDEYREGNLWNNSYKDEHKKRA